MLQLVVQGKLVAVNLQQHRQSLHPANGLLTKYECKLGEACLPSIARVRKRGLPIAACCRPTMFLVHNCSAAAGALAGAMQALTACLQHALLLKPAPPEDPCLPFTVLKQTKMWFHYVHTSAARPNLPSAFVSPCCCC
jgi:hypothetical protein